VERAIAHLIQLGATVLHKHDIDTVNHYAVTMADPEGNELCIA
jgi:hypothetical protein